MNIILIILLLIPSISFASLKYDNTDDSISCGTSDILTENGSMTVSFWMNQAGAGTNGRIFQRGTVLLYVDQGGDGKAMLFEVGGSVTGTRVTADATISYNTWTNFTITWDGSTTMTNVHIYKNGTEVSYGTGGNITTPTDNSGQTLYIGNRSTADRTFNGQISSFAVWQGTVLSAGDITTLYKGGKWAPMYVATSPTRFWPMMEKSSSTAANAGTVVDMKAVANCTADDGANNTGMTWEYENFNNRGDMI